MSKVRTMQEVLSESEEITFKKKDIFDKMQKLQSKIIELHENNKEIGAERVFKSKQFIKLTELFNNLKAERDTLNSTVKELRKELDDIKKSNVKKVQQFTGLDKIITLESDEKGVEEVYNKKYAKKYDDWVKSLE